MEAAYACVRAWGQGHQDTDTAGRRKRLFAFFNSGNQSGASQPHRHLQFLPVESMRQDGTGNWEPLIDRVAEAQATGSGLRRLEQLPFAHFALPVPSNPSADTLHAMYLSLYRAAVKAAQDDEKTTVDGVSAEGEAVISYNLALTDSTMMICPRRNENAQISVDSEADDQVAEPGIVALNGTILAGTLMVKAEAEWDELRKNHGNLTDILSTIGYSQLDSRELSSL